MKFFKKISPYAFALVLLGLANLSLAQDQPDNSGANKDHAVTADSQSQASQDRAITKKIRQAIIADKSLSTYAHNVKIITVNGKVTLKGPVRSEDEKTKVAGEAASVVSANLITDQLTVKTQ